MRRRSAASAAAPARRCGDCVVYCPEGILTHVGTTDCDVDEDYCKGCGLCVAQCPRSALAMLPT